MSKEKKTEENTFSYKNEEDTAELKKFDHKKWIFLGVGGLTIISLIILGAIYFNERATFALIFSFFWSYLWILPLIATSLRAYKIGLHLKHESKIGRVFMLFGFYFLFLFVTSLTSLLLYLGSVNITVITYIVFWGSVAVFAPLLLFILITRL